MRRCEILRSMAYVGRRVMQTVFLLAMSSPVHALGVADGYAPAVSGNVLALVAQRDGHALIGGLFSTVGGEPCASLCRLTVDGRIAPGFVRTGVDGIVFALRAQADGKLLVGGDFSTIVGQPRTQLARLHADGSLDPAFNAGIAGGIVSAIALQADGKILIGGTFTSVGGASRARLARLFADGRVDLSFAVIGSTIVSEVNAIVALDNGSILIGGAFDIFAGANVSNLVRLSASGALDSTSTLSANARVLALAREADGRILVGGDFSQIGAVARTRLARLDATGELATTGMVSVNDSVRSIVVLDDGDVLLGGSFSTVSILPRSGLARLQRGGGVLVAYAPQVGGGAVAAMAVQPDGQLLIGGGFNVVEGNERQSLARLHPGGALDATFQRNPVELTSILATATTPDDRILVGGSFNTLGGLQRPAVARLLQSGAIDTAFAPPAVLSNTIRTLSALANGAVIAGGRRGAIPIALRFDGAGAGGNIATPLLGANVNVMLGENNGRTLVAGGFDQIAGAPRANIARLSADGSLDPEFTAATDDQIFTAARDAELVLIGGAFTSVNGTPRAHLARLNGNGQLDASFAAAVDGFVFAIANRPFGAILIGGAFQTVDGVSRPHLARLLNDGSLDMSFAPDINGDIQGIFLQADGGMIVIGDFSAIDGRTIAGIARLRATGRLDQAFTPVSITGASSEILTATVQRDGRVLIGGRFDSVNGQPRRDVARLATGSPALESLRAEGTSVFWQRAGAAPELSDFPTAALSSDGVSFGSPSQMRPVADGWLADRLSLAVGEQVYVRISAESAGGNYSASRSRTERVLRYVLTDRIFRHGFD